MKKCRVCGAENSDDAIICVKCGSRLSSQISENLPFELLENEEILADIKPERSLVIKLMAPAILLSIIIFIISLLPIIARLYLDAIVILIIMALVLLSGWLIGLMAYKKYRYWITNLRVIGKIGIIAYQINSIPLENITDVIVRRQILDRMLNLSSLIVTPMGIAQTSSWSSSGISANSTYFPALRPQKASELQKLIFHLRDLRKK